jgi:hypothetical protein
VGSPLKTNLLRSWYRNALQKSEEFLKKEGYVYRKLDSLEKDYPKGKDWSIVWTIDVELSSRKVELLLCLPKTFPDKFPEVYVSENTHRQIYPIPHLDNNRLLCTFDPGESSPNSDKPDEIVKEVIARAIKTVEEGISNTNSSDYKDEFSAYWRLESDVKFLSFCTPPDEKSYLKLIRFSKKWQYYSGIIVKKVEDAQSWCESLHVTWDRNNISNVLYLPIEDFGNPPFPSTIKELYDRLGKFSPLALKKLESFYGGQDNNHLVMFALAAGTDIILAMLHLPRLSDKKIPGFRLGKAPHKLLINHYKHDRIIRFEIDRADSKRLFYRGGGRTYVADNVSVSMIGCGSIGSALASTLVKTGLNTIYLIDPEELTIENIARHYCGMADIGFKKADILSQRLREHFPHIQCTPYAGDILHLLLEDNSVLDKYSLNIVAVGSLPVERRLNALLQRKSIISPMLFIWVEPLLVAGHALFVNPNSPGCYECLLDENLDMKYMVIGDGSSFLKREAGCQTSYIPYASLEIDYFVNIVARFIISILNGELLDSTILTWIGDIEHFRESGYKTSDFWVASSSYTEHKMKLSSGSLCEKCLSKL